MISTVFKSIFLYLVATILIVACTAIFSRQIPHDLFILGIPIKEFVLGFPVPVLVVIGSILARHYADMWTFRCKKSEDKREQDKIRLAIRRPYRETMDQIIRSASQPGYFIVIDGNVINAGKKQYGIDNIQDYLEAHKAILFLQEDGRIMQRDSVAQIFDVDVKHPENIKLIKENL